MKESHHTHGPGPIHKPIGFLVDPLKRFTLIEAADGGILLLADLTALVIANSPFGPSYIAFWQKDLGLVAGNTTVRTPLQLWINDGLMAVFFFVVGSEFSVSVGWR
jgi:NhaA family Na+:H+ antiporter